MRVTVYAALLSVVCAAPLPAVAASRLATHLDAIAARPAYAHTQFGLAVYDLRTRSMLYARNAGRFFVAASTTKLLTEGTTLATLGPGYRFRTIVYRTGPLDAAGILHGDLVLVASGDPNLSGRLRPDGTLAFENEDHSYDGSPDTKAVPGDPLAALRDLAAQIAARGVKQITGNVVVDDSLYPAGTPESGTGVVISPIMVNDNIVDLTVTPAARPGDPVVVSVSPQTPYATFVNKATTGAKGTRRTIIVPDGEAAPDGSRTVTITGSIPVDSQPILYAYDVPSPRRFAEFAFAQTLAAAGVSVAKSSTELAMNHDALKPFYTDSNAIATHISPPLSEEVKVTLKVSDNLHAATMPYLWAPTHDLQKGFGVERSFLQRGGLDTSAAVQNGGLGGDAFFTPSFMVAYLAYVRAQPFFPVLYASLPVLGVGTLFNIQNGSPAAGQVHAKTGTWGTGDLLNDRSMISGKGLAGYMTTASGREIAFCFYLNNLAGPPDETAPRAAGQILGELATATYLYAK